MQPLGYCHIYIYIELLITSANGKWDLIRHSLNAELNPICHLLALLGALYIYI
jgi:hypothetical protein